MYALDSGVGAPSNATGKETGKYVGKCQSLWQWLNWQKKCHFIEPPLINFILPSPMVPDRWPPVQRNQYSKKHSLQLFSHLDQQHNSKVGGWYDGCRKQWQTKSSTDILHLLCPCNNNLSYRLRLVGILQCFSTIIVNELLLTSYAHYNCSSSCFGYTIKEAA